MKNLLALFCGRLAAIVTSGLIALPMTLGSLEARAQHAVMVELFTSQGCYSCPPADEVLGQLAVNDDIVALSMHVDYWDYLGWRDTFAQPAFTERQYGYKVSMGERVVYTPQMIIQGVAPVTGSRSMSVKDAILQARAQDKPARITIVEAANGLKGRITPLSGSASASVFIAKYTRSRTVEIARGENGGKTLTYHNVVDMLSPLGTWSGSAARELDLPRPMAGEGIALWIQDGPTGQILAAAKYEK